jgi:hypothetical protein
MNMRGKDRAISGDRLGDHRVFADLSTGNENIKGLWVLDCGEDKR